MAEAVIVEAVRSPVGKRNGGLSGVHPADLSAQVLSGLVQRAGVDPALVDDVIWGCVMQAGEQALDAWLGRATDEMPQLRDLAILKVFFGADPENIARVRLLAHQARLKNYELLREAGGVSYPGPRRAIEAAIAHERTSIRYWGALAKPTDDTSHHGTQD